MAMENVKEKIAEIAELPKDIIMDSPRLIILGNFEVSIENHKGLIEYNSDKIRVNTGIGVYKITGEDLTIKRITMEDIVIDGKIENIDISN